MVLFRLFSCAVVFAAAASSQALPSAFSIGPTSGGGALQNFKLSLAGISVNLVSVYVLIGDTPDPARGCLFGAMLQAFGHDLVLGDEQGTGFVHLNNSTVVRNSRCSLLKQGSGIGGTNLRLNHNFEIGFRPALAGTKKIFILAATNSGNSGWLERGTWTVPAAGEPGIINMYPTVAAINAGGFYARFFHSTGAGGHYKAYMLFLPTPSTTQFNATGSCLIEYNRISNGMRLIDDAGTGWLGPESGVPVNAGAGSLQNSRCSVDLSLTSITIDQESMEIGTTVNFKAGTPAVLGTFLQALDVNGKWTGMQQVGSWMIPGAAPKSGPAIVSLTPFSGNSNGTTFGLHVTHSMAASLLNTVHLRVSDVIDRSVACQFIYFPHANTVNLVNDAGDALVSPAGAPLGSAGLLSNSRCSLDPALSSASTSGNSLFLNLRVAATDPLMQFGPLFLNAFDDTGLTTHWLQGGFWNPL